MKVQKIDGTTSDENIYKWRAKKSASPFKYLTANILEDGIHIYLVTRYKKEENFNIITKYTAEELAVCDKFSFRWSNDESLKDTREGLLIRNQYLGVERDKRHIKKCFESYYGEACLEGVNRPAFLYNDYGKIKKKGGINAITKYLSDFLNRDDCSTDLPDISNILEEKFRGNFFKNNFKQALRNISSWEEIPAVFSYIQRVNSDIAAVRFFCKRKKITEIGRIICKDNEQALFLTRAGDKFVECKENLLCGSFDFFIIGYDDFSGHFFNRYEKYFNKGYLLSATLYCNAFENIIRMDNYELINSILRYNRITPLENVKNLFSFTAEAPFEVNSFAKLIDVPSWAISEMTSNDFSCNLIKFINTFPQDLRKYFWSIDKNILREISKDFSYFEANCVESTNTCLTNMINLYGKEKLSKYTKHLIYLMQNVGNYGIQLYSDYLNMVNEMYIGGNIENLDLYPWKIYNQAEILRRHDEVVIEYNGTDTSVDSEKFEEYAKKCEMYKYEKDGLFIKYPTSSIDIKIEGNVLRHCVNTYTSAILNGGMTILFIRKKEKPDEPFFTLEIRHKKMQQCHGKCNCNMTPEIINFMKSFCKEKGIIYNEHKFNH